jgi:hypothetical protein
MLLIKINILEVKKVSLLSVAGKCYLPNCCWGGGGAAL